MQVGDKGLDGGKEIGVGWCLGGRCQGDESFTGKAEMTLYMTFVIFVSASETKVSSKKQSAERHGETKIKETRNLRNLRFFVHPKVFSTISG